MMEANEEEDKNSSSGGWIQLELEAEKKRCMEWKMRAKEAEGQAILLRTRVNDIEDEADAADPFLELGLLRRPIPRHFTYTLTRH